ncbi:MAG TPA: hypothetical protein VIO94_09445 [Phenylobacterium sp.]
MALRTMNARQSDPGGGSRMSNCGIVGESSIAKSLAITLNLSTAPIAWTVPSEAVAWDGVNC